MASLANTIDTGNGIAKRVEGDIVDLMPAKHLKFSKAIKYDSKRKVGAEFVEPVWLTKEAGFTYGGTSGVKRTLNNPVAATSKMASYTPPSLHFRTEIVHEILSMTAEKGAQAFERLIDAVMRNAKRAFDEREEQSLIYGGSYLAKLDAAATDGGTTITMPLDAWLYAPGPFLGIGNCELDAYKADGTPLNTRAPLVATSFNIKTRALVCTGNADDINDIVTAAADVYVYYRGQYGLDGTGVYGVASLTSSSGNYLGIATGTYTDFWNATQFTYVASTTSLTWSGLNEALIEAAQRGLTGDVRVMVPLHAWQDLASSLDSLRVLDKSYNAKRSEMGQDIESLSYHVITGGKATIECSLFVKNAHVIMFADPDDPMVDIARIGSSAPTFKIPSFGGEEIMVQQSGTNAVELGMFAQRGLYAPCPRNFVKMSGSATT